VTIVTMTTEDAEDAAFIDDRPLSELSLSDQMHVTTIAFKKEKKKSVFDICAHGNQTQQYEAKAGISREGVCREGGGALQDQNM
jgi:hypothetical protein